MLDLHRSPGNALRSLTIPTAQTRLRRDVNDHVPAFIGLVVSLLLVVSLGSLAGGYAQGSLLWVVNNIYFQYYSLFIFLVSVGVMVGVSYLTAAPAYAQLEGLTFGTVTEAQQRESRGSWNRWDVINSCLVLLLILAAYLSFRG